MRVDLRSLFKYVDLKKKLVGYPFIISFEGQSVPSGSQEIWMPFFGEPSFGFF
jgi:hypothetical protein